MKTFSAFSLLLFIACNDCANKLTPNTSKSIINFSGKYTICDSCNTTILVHHEECTDCGEISVDSGIVYLTNKILNTADSLSNTINIANSPTISSNKVSLKELYFNNQYYFSILWKDTVDFKDFDKAFRLTGKIVDLKHRVLKNGTLTATPSLIFEVSEALEVDNSYLKKNISK